MVNNFLYLRRHSKIVPPTGAGEAAPTNYLASLLKNIEALGVTFSEPLLQACQSLPLEPLTVLYNALIPDLKRAKGAYRKFEPMYPCPHCSCQ